MKKVKKYILLIISFFVFPTMILASEKVSCGNITDIPKKIPELTSFFVTAAEVIAIVILVLMGSIDLFKGIISSKEEEIKKGQQTFIKRLIIAAIIFFVVVVVKFIVGIIAEGATNNIISCIDCFISNNCENSANNINNSQNNSKKNNGSNGNKNEEIDLSNLFDGKTVQNKESSNKNKEKTNKKSTTENKSSKKANTLYVGDSRTVHMCQVYNLCGSDYIAKSSMAYDWFVSDGIPYVNGKIKSKEYNVVILMGVNGLYNNNGKANAEQYYNKVSSLAKNEWKKQNVIFVSVNPVYDSRTYYTKMKDVNGFNNTMKSKISSSGLSNLKYCDTASKLNLSASNYDSEGLHYDKSTYEKIASIIKSNCLK